MPERRIDEFAFVLAAGVIFILLLMIFWTTPPEPIPIVEPRSITIIVAPGKTRYFYLTIKGPATNVVLSAQNGVKNWLEFEKNNFNVIEETKVRVFVEVPEDVEEKIYTGVIVVRSAGGKIEIPVEVNVKEVEVVEELFSRTFLLGDFVIERGTFKEIASRAKDFEVFRSYLSKQVEKIIAEIPEDKLDKISKAELDIEIESTNSLGKLIVIFNEEKIFDRKVGVGLVEIEIERGLINRTNTILIVSSTPGFRFWATNFYRISEVSFEVTYEGVYEKSFYFEVSPEIAENFVELGINFRRITERAIELIIEINDQIIYFEKPKIWVNKVFSKDILGNPILLSTENTLIFRLEKEGKIEIENARLIVYYA